MAAVSGTPSLMAVEDPSVVQYLGDGVDVFARSSLEAFKKSGVVVGSAQRQAGEQEFKGIFKFVSESTSIATGIEFNGDASASGAFGALSLSASLQVELSKHTAFKQNVVSMVVAYDYTFGHVIADQVVLRPSAKTDPLCMDHGVFNMALFFKHYGHGFVNKVKLGEQLYIVYEAEILDTSTTTKTRVKAALKAKYKAFGGEVSAEEKEENAKALSRTHISGFVYATGGFAPPVPPDDVKAVDQIVAAWHNWLQNRPETKLSIIETRVMSYEPLLGAEFNAGDRVDDDLIKMLYLQRLFGWIEQVEHWTTDGTLINKCAQGRELVAAEIEKCRKCIHDAKSFEELKTNEIIAALLSARDLMRISIQVRAHVADKGWLPWVGPGQTAGTTGESRRAEAIQICLPEEADPSWSISYRVHAAHKGWMDWVTNGHIAGTTGEGRQIEAIQVIIRGMPSWYNVRYRAHVADKGWMDWVMDGATAGTTGQSRRLEAIEVQIISK